MRFKTARVLVPTEHEAQVAYFDWVRAMAQSDWRFKHIYSIPNERIPTKYNLQRLVAAGLRPGYPDINVDIPLRRPDGSIKCCGLRIEHKRKGGKLTDNQRCVLMEIQSSSFYEVKVCWSADELMSATIDYLARDGR